ncbi:hypothetical protein [Cribrihabitans pelagius]|uniref:hypothetical protein n=1 Tax=Cribrihabitans pelagius TaxID=1765746 RepID=UPI003B5B1692
MAMADMDKGSGKGADAGSGTGQRELDGLFAAARAQRPGLPRDLEAAILGDAARVQESWAQERRARDSCDSAGPRARPASRRPGWRQLAAAVGGWPAMGGLAAAGVAGLWLGLSPPGFVPDPVALAGLGSAETEADLPYDGFDLAIVLDGDLQ